MSSAPSKMAAQDLSPLDEEMSPLDLLRVAVSFTSSKKKHIFIITAEDMYETHFGDGSYEHLRFAFWDEEIAERRVKELNKQARQPKTKQSKGPFLGETYVGEQFRVLGICVGFGSQEGDDFRDSGTEGKLIILKQVLPDHDRTITVENIAKLLANDHGG